MQWQSTPISIPGQGHPQPCAYIAGRLLLHFPIAHPLPAMQFHPLLFHCAGQ